MGRLGFAQLPHTQSLVPKDGGHEVSLLSSPLHQFTFCSYFSRNFSLNTHQLAVAMFNTRHKWKSEYKRARMMAQDIEGAKGGGIDLGGMEVQRGAAPCVQLQHGCIYLPSLDG